MAKPRVHEVAAEMGVTSKDALKVLQAMGEFVKGPSSSIEPPLARKLRQALQMQKLSTLAPTSELPFSPEDGEHPSAFAARVRRSVISRVDTNWARYGFSATERKQWMQAGIPFGKAHIAAMCRATLEDRPNRSSALSMENLRLRIDGETVAHALVTGTNSIRAQTRLATAKGLGTPDIPRRLETLQNESLMHSAAGVGNLKKALQETSWIPKQVPAIAKLHRSAIELATPLLAAHAELREQADIFRNGGEAGPVLTAYGRIHGVFDPDKWLLALLDGIEGEAQSYRRSLRSAQLIARAALRRNYLYLAGSPTPEALATTTVDADEFIAETGYALISGPKGQDRGEWLLAWVRAGDTILSTMRSRQDMLLGLPKGSASVAPVDEWSIGETGALPRSAQLVRLIASLDRAQASTPSGAERAASSDDTGRERNASLSDDVVVVYRGTGTGKGRSSSAAERRLPSHRWMVRGHHRRQWYRSEQRHKTIWIDSHEAGPADAPLLVREHVRVVRDRT